MHGGAVAGGCLCGRPPDGALAAVVGVYSSASQTECDFSVGRLYKCALRVVEQ